MAGIARHRIVTAAALAALFLALAASHSHAEDLHPEKGFVWMVSGDNAQAAVGTFVPGERSITDAGLSGVHVAARLDSYGSLIFLLEGFGVDALLALSFDHPDYPIMNLSAGTLGDPTAFVGYSSRKGYILRRRNPYVLLFDSVKGDSIGSLWLGKYADSDGVPEMVDGELVGTTLYVLLQRLKSSTNEAEERGCLALASILDFRSTDSLMLSIRNPLRLELSQDRNRMLICGGPDLHSPGVSPEAIEYAGIDTVNLATNGVGRMIDGSALGGSVTDVVFSPDGVHCWAIAQTSEPLFTRVYRIGISSGTVVDSITGLEAPVDLEVTASGKLVIADRGITKSGLYVCDGITGAFEQMRVEGTFPPGDVEFAVANSIPEFDSPVSFPWYSEHSLELHPTDDDGDEVKITPLWLADGLSFDSTSNVISGIYTVPRISGYDEFCGLIQLDDGYNTAIEHIGVGSPIATVLAGQSPSETTLHAPCPNPFNPSTQVRWEITEGARTALRVYDISGRLVRTLVDGYCDAGVYTARWDGRDRQGRSMGSGVYLMRLETPTEAFTQRVTLVR